MAIETESYFCLMASSQNGNTSEFRVRAKRILLTYSQVGVHWDYHGLAQLIGRLGARGIICRELHQDGGIHYHALLVFDRAYQTRDVTHFDVGNTHPNIKPIRFTPRKAYDYCRKDGDVVWTNLSDEDIDGPGRSSSTLWADIIAQPDKESFFDALKSMDPRALVCSFTSIEKYADWAYREEPTPYDSPVEFTDPTVRDEFECLELEEWYNETIGGRRTGR